MNEFINIAYTFSSRKVSDIFAQRGRIEKGSMEVLDPGDDDPRWRRIATPNNEHYGYTDAYEAKGAGASVATEGNNFYIVGGDEDWRSKGSAAIEKFDVEEQKWNFVTNMSFARRETGVAVLDGKIYVTGGFDEKGKKRLNDVECYDISSKTWYLLSMDRSLLLEEASLALKSMMWTTIPGPSKKRTLIHIHMGLSA